MRCLSNLQFQVFKKGACLASGEAPIHPGMLPQWDSSTTDESLSPKEEMKQMLDQREPGELYSEEKEKGWETDTEFRRGGKEMSQVMIHTDVRVTSTF